MSKLTTSIGNGAREFRKWLIPTLMTIVFGLTAALFGYVANSLHNQLEEQKTRFLNNLRDMHTAFDQQLNVIRYEVSEIRKTESAQATTIGVLSERTTEINRRLERMDGKLDELRNKARVAGTLDLETRQ